MGENQSFTGTPTGNVHLSDMEVRGTDGMTNEEREQHYRTTPCAYCRKREGEWYGTVCPKCQKLRIEWDKYFKAVSSKNNEIDEKIKKIRASLDFHESINIDQDGKLIITFYDECYSIDEISKRLEEIKKNENNIKKTIEETRIKLECLEKQKISIEPCDEWVRNYLEKKCQEEKTSGQSGLKRN